MYNSIKMVPVILLAVFAVTLPAQDFAVDGIEYGITSTSPAEVEVVGYTGSATAVTIPQQSMVTVQMITGSSIIFPKMNP